MPLTGFRTRPIMVGSDFYRGELPMNDRKKGMIAATLAFVIFGLSYLF